MFRCRSNQSQSKEIRTETLTQIKNDKFDIIFLHVVFWSQSILKPNGDQIGFDTN
jgi:hypothetical protein